MIDPWLAPDGREWFNSKRARRVMRPEPSMFKDRQYYRRTHTAIASAHFCSLHRAGPLGRAALLALGATGG